MNLIKFFKNIFNQLKILKPQLFVSYKREYYVSKISKIRLNYKIFVIKDFILKTKSERI